MTGDWQPDGVLESELAAARAAGDQDAFLIRLAAAELLFPLMDSADPPNWAVSEISGRPCIVSFTSEDALRRLLPGDPPTRLAGFAELAQSWPDLSLSLAVNPGLPIEIYLSAEAMFDLAGVAAQPRTDLERELALALEASDPAAYAKALLQAELCLPVYPGGSPSRDITDPEFSWWREEDAVLAFSSEERLRAAIGLADFVQLPAVEVLRGWSPEVALLIDAGTAFTGRLSGEFLLELAGSITEAERVTDEAIRQAQQRTDLDEGGQVELAAALLRHRLHGEPLPDWALAPVIPEPPTLDWGPVLELDPVPVSRTPDAEPGAAPAAPTVPTGVAVQVVLHASQVDRYLRAGHGRLAGLIHRAPDRPTPLAELYGSLGLLGDGSVFGAGDQVGYVIRWYESDPDAYLAPAMDGVEVPGDATLWLIADTGAERPLATFHPGSGWERARHP